MLALIHRTVFEMFCVKKYGWYVCLDAENTKLNETSIGTNALNIIKFTNT